MLGSLGLAGTTLQQKFSGLSAFESLLDPSAQAPVQDTSLSPYQAPVSVPTAQRPSSPPMQSPVHRSSQDPAGRSQSALVEVGSDVNTTVAGLVGQINIAVASLNSTTAAAVDSLTAAVQRYNAAAAALEATSGMVNVTERLMSGLSAETDLAMQTLQSILNSTGDTVAGIFQGMTSDLQNETAAAGPNVLAGAEQLESFVRGAVMQAAEALQGVRGAISDGAAAAGNANASAAAAGVTNTASGLQTTLNTLRSATVGALTGVGGAALGLNTTLVSFGRGLMGLAARAALLNPVAGLEAPLNRTRQVAALAGDLQDILGTTALGSMPPALQSVFLGVSASPPSSMVAPNLTALDNSLLQLLSEDSAQPSLVPDQAPLPALSMPPPQTSIQAPVPTPALSPSQPPVQAPLVAPSMPLSQPPVQAPVAAPGPSSTPWAPPQLLPRVASGLGAATNTLQAVSRDAQGLNALLGSGVLGLNSPSDAGGGAGPGGLDLTSADSQLLQLLSTVGPETAQAPDQDIASMAPDPAAVNLTGADSDLLSLLSASGPAPVQAPSSRPGSPAQAFQRSPEARPPATRAHTPASHTRHTLQVVTCNASSPPSLYAACVQATHCYQLDGRFTGLLQHVLCISCDIRLHLEARVSCCTRCCCVPAVMLKQSRAA